MAGERVVEEESKRVLRTAHVRADSHPSGCGGLSHECRPRVTITAPFSPCLIAGYRQWAPSAASPVGRSEWSAAMCAGRQLRLPHRPRAREESLGMRAVRQAQAGHDAHTSTMTPSPFVTQGPPPVLGASVHCAAPRARSILREQREYVFHGVPTVRGATSLTSVAWDA
ncbi:hypothetical protein WOLCODRAFT_160016 [Wolfiporia cocos MD-104 SS10]|uniref:Uncharacterized protein n=1 Tax=Wolfiporia cocos (strain MD-104) TaxID=742152 RepID=A0A2H3JBN8_WOLCO|nr:hypothetical protein WOLCODRAFT_160016 [Wolfiporia cocos MD-104 SS10]